MSSSRNIFFSEKKICFASGYVLDCNVRKTGFCTVLLKWNEFISDLLISVAYCMLVNVEYIVINNNLFNDLYR